MAIGELYVSDAIAELSFDDHSYNWWHNNSGKPELSFMESRIPDNYLERHKPYLKGFLPEELL